MNLPFAATCFRNALVLTQQLIETKTVQPLVPSETSTNDAPDQSWTSLDQLRQAALIHLAYAHLCMHEPHLALAKAKEVLTLPSCTRSNRYAPLIFK